MYKHHIITRAAMHKLQCQHMEAQYRHKYEIRTRDDRQKESDKKVNFLEKALYLKSQELHEVTSELRSLQAKYDDLMQGLVPIQDLILSNQRRDRIMERNDEFYGYKQILSSSSTGAGTKYLVLDHNNGTWLTRPRDLSSEEDKKTFQRRQKSEYNKQWMESNRAATSKKGMEDRLKAIRAMEVESLGLRARLEPSTSSQQSEPKRPREKPSKRTYRIKPNYL